MIVYLANNKVPITRVSNHQGFLKSKPLKFRVSQTPAFVMDTRSCHAIFLKKNTINTGTLLR